VAMPQHDQDADVDAGVAAAIATQFGGDAVLYHAYAATCTVPLIVNATEAVGTIGVNDPPTADAGITG